MITASARPGLRLESDGKHVLMLPGPPRECREMLFKCAVPYLKKLSDQEIHSHNIHIFGLGESAVEARLRDMMNSMKNPTLAPYAKDSEVQLRLTAKAKSKAEADDMMAPALEKYGVFWEISSTALTPNPLKIRSWLLKEKQNALRRRILHRRPAVKAPYRYRRRFRSVCRRYGDIFGRIKNSAPGRRRRAHQEKGRRQPGGRRTDGGHGPISL